MAENLDLLRLCLNSVDGICVYFERVYAVHSQVVLNAKKVKTSEF